MIDAHRTLVFGSRDWADQDMVWSVLDGLYQQFNCGWMTVDMRPFVIIEGEARGADTLARDWVFNSPLHGPLVEHDKNLVRSPNLPSDCPVSILRYPARWELYGKSAGPIRNQQMYDEGHPTFGLCFKDGFDHSYRAGGSEHMASFLKGHDVPVWLHQHL